MVRSITKDTVLCMSLAGRPSNIGTGFHNFLYAELGLDFVYKAFTTTDLAAAIAGIRALGIRGCGVSMPYKEACIELVDELDDSAEAIGSVNTIVNTDGHLRAYNTDYLAIAKLLAARQVPVDHTFAVLGSGGMAKAVVAALRDAGFHTGAVVARNARTGTALADQYGYTWRAELGSSRPQLLVNATPVGMSGGPAADDLPAEPEVVDAAETVFDVVALPALTPLVRRARAQGKQLITGAEVIGLQALEQFVLYTGVRPSDDQVRRASDFLPRIAQYGELPSRRMLPSSNWGTYCCSVMARLRRPPVQPPRCLPPALQPRSLLGRGLTLSPFSRVGRSGRGP